MSSYVCTNNNQVAYKALKWKCQKLVKVPCKSLTEPSLLNQIKSVVFDKTGTLTHGKPEVTHVMLFVAERVCPHQLFTAIVGLAEQNSEHPLGVAITEFARKVRHTEVTQLLPKT